MTAGRVSVIVCRGCCCGSEQKHPDVAHDAQVAVLGAGLPASGRLWTVDCLGPCERSNVVVVRTRAAGRRWFGGVLEPGQTDALATWIAGGAIDPPPSSIAALAFSPDDDRG